MEKLDHLRTEGAGDGERERTQCFFSTFIITSYKETLKYILLLQDISDNGSPQLLITCDP